MRNICLVFIDTIKESLINLFISFLKVLDHIIIAILKSLSWVLAISHTAGPAVVAWLGSGETYCLGCYCGLELLPRHLGLGCLGWKFWCLALFLLGGPLFLGSFCPLWILGLCAGCMLSVGNAMIPLPGMVTGGPR